MLSPINIILFVWYWNLTWVSITTIINYQITYFRSLSTSFLSLILGLIIMILMWISLDFCWILLCSSSDHLPEEVGTTFTVSMIAVVDLWFYIRTLICNEVHIRPRNDVHRFSYETFPMTGRITFLGKKRS